MQKKHEILVVDDKKENLQLLHTVLAQYGCRVRTALSGETALLSIGAKKPDLILLDINMPNMDGYEVCSTLKNDASTADIPVIFISAKGDVDAKIKAFELGAVDYVTKPFSTREVLARVKTHLLLNDYQHSLEELVEGKVKEIKDLNKQLELTQNEMASTLGAFMEERDDDTGRHVQRVAAISRFIAIKYGLSLDDVKLIYRAAPFHDAGKVSIPDNILKKADVFEDHEWEIMKTHAIKGYEIFKDAKSPMLKMAAIIAKEHHERWDGKGYPFGLKGEEISIAGRIVILADIFDALIHKRVYKDAWDIQDAIEYIQNNRAKIFEPKMVDILLENTDEFIEIVNSLSDD